MDKDEEKVIPKTVNRIRRSEARRLAAEHSQKHGVNVASRVEADAHGNERLVYDMETPTGATVTLYALPDTGAGRNPKEK